MSDRDGVWTVHCDGASRGNPGASAIGCVVRDPSGKVRARVGRAIGFATNNEAEYRAVIAGLEAASSLRAEAVDLVLDSELIVRQLEGRYRVRKAELRPLYDRVVELSAGFGRFTPRHVPRQQNRDADALANSALDGRPIDETL